MKGDFVKGDRGFKGSKGDPGPAGVSNVLPVHAKMEKVFTYFNLCV